MGRRIAIVGNGPVPEGVAERIDACDLVIRFNDCRSVGRAGRKTDIVAICNTGRPGRAMSGDPAWRDSPAVRQAAAFWLVRDPVKFASMEASILAQWPELDDFCADHSAALAAIAGAQGKSHAIIAASVHEAVDAALREFSPEAYVCPSSGLVAIAHVLNAGDFAYDAVSIAGFSHEGWAGHPFAAEKQWVDRLAAQGRLTRLTPAEVTAPAEGTGAG